MCWCMDRFVVNYCTHFVVIMWNAKSIGESDLIFKATYHLRKVQPFYTSDAHVQDNGHVQDCRYQKYLYSINWTETTKEKQRDWKVWLEKGPNTVRNSSLAAPLSLYLSDRRRFLQCTATHGNTVKTRMHSRFLRL